MTIFFLARVVISYAAHRFISTCTVTSGEDLACFANSGISGETTVMWICPLDIALIVCYLF